MSVLIRDMEAPHSCDACPFYDDISRYCDGVVPGAGSGRYIKRQRAGVRAEGRR